MIPAIFSKLVEETEQIEEVDCFLITFIPGPVIENRSIIMGVALNPNNGQFFNAPMQLFKAKMQSAPTIVRPNDAIN